VNVVARAPGGNEAWVIENLPIFEDVSGEHEPVRETAYVNLAPHVHANRSPNRDAVAQRDAQLKSRGWTTEDNAPPRP
jgi:hypothetical protein